MLGPKMKSVLGLYQLSRDTDAVARFANAALQNVLDAKLTGDFGKFRVLPFEIKC